jgi:hypothetical protein
MTHEWTKGPTKWTEGNTLFVSVPFTWNLPEVMRQARQPDMFYKSVVVGGPAIRLAQVKLPELLADLPEWVEIGDECEDALQRMNPQATRTTVGCVRKCDFCAVPITEGKFRELDDWPDKPIICDNNLLAASQTHFDRVCDRLEKHSWCDFNQGLDARLMTDYHAERIGRLRGAKVRLALDHSSLIDAWTRTYELLRKHKVAKSRISTYVLCGFKSDPVDAWRRCEHVDNRGSPAALPQWYHPLDAMEYNAVLPCHREFGWDKKEKNRIMGYYYQHRGGLPVVGVRRCERGQGLLETKNGMMI